MRQHSGQRRTTFQQILETAAAESGRRLMIKARQFSRIAKLVPEDWQRNELYLRKAFCLWGIRRKCRLGTLAPEPSSGDTTLHLFRFGPGSGLHTKPEWLQEARKRFAG